MSDNNGVNISNREIYDAVMEVSAKLDQHITEHRVKDAVAGEKVASKRHLISTWAAVCVGILGGSVGLVDLLK